MLPTLVTAAALPALALAVFSSIDKDLGNGVHVPGAVPVNSLEPLQHRLAYAGTDGMTVSWSTFAQLDMPQVRYGFRPDNLEFTANSTLSSTYPTSRTYNNHVKLSGLKPGTKYYYQVSYTNIGSSAYLPTFTFTTARAPGDETPYTAAIFGDLGLMGDDGLSTRHGPFGGPDVAVLEANETNTIQSLLALKDTYDLMIHVGDIGYSDYFLKESTQGYFGTDNASTQPTREQVAEHYESMSEQFFDQMRPITAEKPWMVSPGNHEANCDNGGVTDKRANITYTSDYCLLGQENFTWFGEHYKMPSYESGGRGNFWYSYDNGLAHYISLQTETDLGGDLVGPIEDVNGPFGRHNEQIDWLKADLAAVDRTLTPWVVVLLHRPWYTSVSPPTWPAWQEAFEQVFYDNEVDVYFTGHVHTYERFKPMFNGTVDPKGYNDPRAPWPVLVGNGGHYDGLDTFDGPERYNGTGFAADKEFGFTRMTFHNRTHATLEAIASRNSSVFDSQTIFKSHAFGGKKKGEKKSDGKKRCGKYLC
ncbi:hypothetical protein JCM10213_000614 [Rhodosporidiobolus nylandii]